jgi:hypothetical protein
MRVAQSQLRLQWRNRQASGVAGAVPARSKAFIATAAGLAGGVGMALPIVIYGWLNAGHAPLELPMAATSWLFGLEHFAQNGYQWGSIVVGILVLAGYGIVHGAIFEGIANRFLGLRTLPETLGAGIAWGFVGWLLFWYTLLPIARDGAPFHMTAASALFVAPTWVFLVGFAILGVATALTYRLLRPST